MTCMSRCILAEVNAEMRELSTDWMERYIQRARKKTGERRNAWKFSQQPILYTVYHISKDDIYKMNNYTHVYTHTLQLKFPSVWMDLFSFKDKLEEEKIAQREKIFNVSWHCRQSCVFFLSIPPNFFFYFIPFNLFHFNRPFLLIIMKKNCWTKVYVAKKRSASFSDTFQR